MAVLYTPHFVQFFDSNGDPLDGGKLHTYAAGTDTPKATYTTAAGDTSHKNPIILDSAGRAIVFLTGSYRFVLTDKNDVPVPEGETDNVTAFTATGEAANSYFQSFSGNGAQTAFTLSEDLGTDEKAIMVFVDNGLGEYSTNGSFGSDTAWTKGSGWSIGGGVATATGAISTAIDQDAAITLVAGQSYTVSYTVTRSAGGITASVGGHAGTERTSSGTYTETIVAAATQKLAFTGNGFTGTIDAVSVTRVMSSGYEIIPPTAYTLNGNTLSFASAPSNGSNNILVFAPSLLVNAASAAAASADVSATNAANSEAAAAISESNAAVSEAAAEDWAIKTDGPVSGGEYSSKYWAQFAGGISLPDGSVTLQKFAAIAANVILANITGGAAAPTAVSIAANKFLARSSAGNIEAKDITDFALSILDDPNVATMLGTLGFTVGNWTPTDASGAGLSFSSNAGRYLYNSSLGIIWAFGTCTYPTTANGNAAKIGGLPQTRSTSAAAQQGSVSYSQGDSAKYILVDSGATTASFFTGSGTTTNATLSAKQQNFNFIYFT